MDYKKPKFKEKYENFIGGKFVPPVGNEYFENNSPIDNTLIAKYPRSQKEDIDNAVIAANKAKEAWGNTSAAERAGLLNKVADIIEANLEEFALVETCDNGKPIRESLNADIPLSVDHWRYFASAIRAEESTMSELDIHTVSLNLKEPLGVIGQIIPWNFPLLMLSWKLPPALATGNCVILKPAEQTPSTATLLMEKIADVFPPGVLISCMVLGLRQANHWLRIRVLTKSLSREKPLRVN